MTSSETVLINTSDTLQKNSFKTCGSKLLYLLWRIWSFRLLVVDILISLVNPIYVCILQSTIREGYSKLQR